MWTLPRFAAHIKVDCLALNGRSFNTTFRLRQTPCLDTLFYPYVPRPNHDLKWTDRRAEDEANGRRRAGRQDTSSDSDVQSDNQQLDDTSMHYGSPRYQACADAPLYSQRSSQRGKFRTNVPFSEP
jgi:hypothetical protein